MASMAHEPAAAATPEVVPLLAAAVKSRLMTRTFARTFDGCPSYAAAVVKMGEGTKMFSILGECQAARDPLRNPIRGYIL